MAMAYPAPGAGPAADPHMGLVPNAARGGSRKKSKKQGKKPMAKGKSLFAPRAAKSAPADVEDESC